MQSFRKASATDLLLPALFASRFACDAIRGHDSAGCGHSDFSFSAFIHEFVFDQRYSNFARPEFIPSASTMRADPTGAMSRVLVV
jgi:hypothetical protein